MKSVHIGLRLWVCLFVGATALECAAQSTNLALWREGYVGDWGYSTNWSALGGNPLPGSGLPVPSSEVEILAGYVRSAGADVTVETLDIGAMSLLAVSSGRVLTVTDTFNCRAFKYAPAVVDLNDGTVNVLNSYTSIVCGLSFEMGTNGSSGLLSLGAEWGSTNALRADFGILDRFSVNLAHGGLRVAASNLSMRNSCSIQNAGQEMTVRGNWENPDGSTVLSVIGTGTGVLSVAGNFNFRGCTLSATVDTNGVSLLDVGGDAVLSNVVLTVGASDALTNTAASYDLIRVPAARTIQTNGMTTLVASNGGFTYAATIEENRGGFDYLVITPAAFLPSVTITNPIENMLFEAVTNVLIQTTVRARGAAITKVEFFADGAKIGETNAAPYQLNWLNVHGGYYEVKAVVTDANGKVGSSPDIGVGVQGIATDGRKVFITGGMVLRYEPGAAQ